ncbi:Sec-independent protein translocase protein TatC [compost metagenome]
MILTPPDIFSQTLLAVPMWMLFEVGLLFGSMARRRDESEAAAAASDGTALASRDDDPQPPAPQA